MFKKYVMNEMPVQINKDLVFKYKDVETATIGHIRQIGFACPKIKPFLVQPLPWLFPVKILRYYITSWEC